MTNVFIGVVSHEGSRFAASQGPNGLGHQLGATLAARGFQTSVRVNTADMVDESALRVDEALVQASLDAEWRVMAHWDNYLSNGHPGLRRRAGASMRRARRLWKRVSPPAPAMVRRLLNIEASHLDLMRTGLASGAAWVIVLEDDAQSSDVADCTDGLEGLLDVEAGAPSYINISRSFTHAELGIDHLLRPVPEVTWTGSVERAVLESDRPVTNTVCALAYRASFLRLLLPAWDALPLTPVVPIDWKLNAVLMDMHARGDLAAGDCWLIDPAPIEQMSMR